MSGATVIDKRMIVVTSVSRIITRPGLIPARTDRDPVGSGNLVNSTTSLE